MRAIVSSELEGIPRGGLSQNLYRTAYWQWRLNSLGRKAEIPPTPEAARARALSSVRQVEPSFAPTYASS